MNKHVRERPTKYPHSIGKVYLNVTTAVLSIVLALTLLKDSLLLSHYIVFTSILATIIFILKIRPQKIVTPSLPQESSFPNEESAPRRRLLLLVFFMIFAILASPLLLAGLMRETPHIWFTVIVGIATGMSISEILFYIYCEKMVSQNA